jgi:hypothetical protein
VTVELMTPASVKRDAPFVVTVDVRSCRPGQSITVTVEQRRGAEPFWPPQSVATLAGESGVASASFTLALKGPATAVLLATAYDRVGTYFNPDGAAIGVL